MTQTRIVRARRFDARDLRANIDAFREALQHAWSRETTSDPDVWSPGCPAWGQCAVTALVVQDLFGGQLLRAQVEGASHYWNELEGGTQIDLTREQFESNDFRPGPIETRSRDYVLSFPSTRSRYDQLHFRLMASWSKG